MKTIDPRQSVASQLKTFTPVGIAISIEESMKNTSTTVGIGTVNMWWAHTSIERKHLGDHPESDQDHDADLGVAEEPEEVLVEDR